MIGRDPLEAALAGAEERRISEVGLARLAAVNRVHECEEFLRQTIEKARDHDGALLRDDPGEATTAPQAAGVCPNCGGVGCYHCRVTHRAANMAHDLKPEIIVANPDSEPE